MTLIQRAVGSLLAILFLLAVFIFASLALGILIAAGLIGWGWLWWRSRAQRARIIEGEYRDETPLQSLEEREQQRL
jgi:hypothetical protein